MSKKITFILIFVFFMFSIVQASPVQRFPKPEFEYGHQQPPTIAPDARSQFMEYLDVFVLLVSLSLISWFILKKRSRWGALGMSVFSIVYFGFIKEGCVCSVGSVQNIALALFNPGYKIPITVIAFFVIPLLFTLFFGRTFCAGICPLGAIQDIIAFRPLKLKSWLQTVLGIIPYLYLGFALLYAATATDFIICRYDPFIGIYRFDAKFSMFVLGATFLLVGVFVARPYCRFFCPYGVLLNLVSRISWKHMTITPTTCIQCKLCENSCPFGAINEPTLDKKKEDRQIAVRRFIILSFILPLLILAGGWVGSQFHENLASVHPRVQLAEELMTFNESSELEPSLELTTYKSLGKSEEDLYVEAASIIREFHVGAWILGGFIGLVFGLSLAGLSINKHRIDYEPDRGSCLSCARCMDYCPMPEEEKPHRLLFAGFRKPVRFK
ncbi:MAG: 4Fe-4S binding protein [Bacteroidetes bacterium]|nr:4Fe-4S binding protein [Bacteroidota bacterium]